LIIAFKYVFSYLYYVVSIQDVYILVRLNNVVHLSWCHSNILQITINIENLLHRWFIILLIYYFIRNILGTLRWKIVECNCVHVQSSSDRLTALSTERTQRQRLLFCTYPARPHATGIVYYCYCCLICNLFRINLFRINFRYNKFQLKTKIWNR